MDRSQPRHKRRRRPGRAIATGLGLVCFLLGSACGSDGPAEVNADDQDPACHPRALMIASSDPNFEWNGPGMDRYLHAYETCLEHAEQLGN